MPPATPPSGSPNRMCRGRRTAFRGCSATSLPGGSRTSSTWAAPTASSMPPAPVRSVPCISPPSDGKGNAIYAPSPEGQKKAILNAYRLADVTPDTIELVEAHGTGTRVGDTAEITALTEVYSITRDAEFSERSAKDRPWCALGSV